MSEIAVKKDGAESGCGEKGKTLTGKNKSDKSKIGKATILWFSERLGRGEISLGMRDSAIEIFQYINEV
ncbi:MAG: hypothetical protein A2W07_08190 [candidate division Zixibacteria bacterium RBG_16_43_9]|nr:MAG: hypothetical protein A2W07_08190 [candidate division Zixibacteria bacterium RBG_16_43_9]